MTISAQQRRYVFERAGRCCEYCLVGDGREPVAFHIDHILSRKHGGEARVDNLCLSCSECNLYKGSAIAAVDPLTDEATKLFNPRQQNWREHFEIKPDASLAGLTPEGRATVAVLRMNEAPRVEQRYGEAQLGNYPCQNKP